MNKVESLERKIKVPNKYLQNIKDFVYDKAIDCAEFGSVGYAMLSNIIPGYIVPSELREKYYDLEDRLFDKTGLYNNHEMKGSIKDARNCGAGVIDFFGGIFILPIIDLCARGIFLEDNDVYPNFMRDNMSDKYLPAMMPVEFTYSMIKASVKKIVHA